MAITVRLSLWVNIGTPALTHTYCSEDRLNWFVVSPIFPKPLSEGQKGSKEKRKTGKKFHRNAKQLRKKCSLFKHYLQEELSNNWVWPICRMGLYHTVAFISLVQLSLCRGGGGLENLSDRYLMEKWRLLVMLNAHHGCLKSRSIC